MPNYRLNLHAHEFKILHNNMLEVSFGGEKAKTTISPSFIKQQLSIWQKLWNATIGTLFKEYSWEGKLVTVDDGKGQAAIKTYYIYQKAFPKLEFKQERIPPQASPKHPGISAETTPLLPAHRPRGSSDSSESTAISTRSTSPTTVSSSPKDLPAHMRPIVGATNRIISWIEELQYTYIKPQPGSSKPKEERAKVKFEAEGILSIEPVSKVTSDRGITESTGLYNVFHGVWHQLQEMKLLSPPVAGGPFPFKDFSQACNVALERIGSLPGGDEKQVKTTMFKAAKFLCDKLGTIRADTKLDKDFFKPPASLETTITTYEERFKERVTK